MKERFIAIGVDGNNIWFKDTKNDKEFLCNYETVDLLNELNNKCADLEFAHRTEMACHRVAEAELKKKIEKLKEKVKELEEQNIKYSKIVNCNNCEYQGYDWYSSGDEFEICEKGNNEEQMYDRFCSEWEEFR